MRGHTRPPQQILQKGKGAATARSRRKILVKLLLINDLDDIDMLDTS